MSFNSPIDAKGEMYTLFNTAWIALALPGSLECETRWEGKEEAAIPPGYFIRVSKKTANTLNGGFLQNGDGSTSQVYDSSGNIFVQVFAPMAAVDSFNNGELLAIAARDIFRGVQTPTGVWFRNAKYAELGNDGTHYQFVVTAEFEFTER